MIRPLIRAFALCLALMLGMVLVSAAPDNASSETKTVSSAVEQTRAHLAKEAFAAAYKSAESIKNINTRADWMSQIAEIESAADAQRAEELIGQNNLNRADRVLKSALISATKNDTSSMPRLRMLYEILKARLANRNARGNAFLDKLKLAIDESDAAFLKRQAFLAKKLKFVKDKQLELTTLAASIPADVTAERMSKVEASWTKLSDESEKLVGYYETLYGQLENKIYSAGLKELESSLDAVLLEASYQRARMYYYQRAWNRARSSVNIGLRIKSGDRRFLDLASRIHALTATKSLLERINRK